jgi:addiction module HigA family antidote
MADITNVHPGMALAEFLSDYNLSQNKLAREIRVPVRRINAIVNGKRAITSDTAVRLSKFFGNRAEFWLGLQELYDITRTKHELAEELLRIHTVAIA